MVNPRKKKLVIEDETETEVPIGSPRRTTTKVSPLKKLKAQVSERKKKSDEHQVEKSVSRQLKRSNLSEKNLSAKPSGLKRLKGEMKMTEGIQEQITEVIQPETRELIRPDQPQVEIENEESSEIKKEREAREKLFGEITEEYYDIIEELPLELDRNFTLIGELDASVQECSEEIHEDLHEYLQIAHYLTHPQKPISSKEVEDQGSSLLSPTERERDVATQLLALASVPNSNLDSNSNSNSNSVETRLPPEFVHSLWGDLARKMARVQKLTRDKLNLAETVYEGLDRHLRRIDAELEKYPDLEDEDEAEQKHQRDEQSISLAGLDSPVQIDQDTSEMHPPAWPLKPLKKPSTKRLTKAIKNSIKHANDPSSSCLAPSHHSPRLTLHMSQPRDPESIGAPESEIFKGHHPDRLTSPGVTVEGLQQAPKTPGAMSPGTLIFGHPTTRKASSIKVTGSFAVSDLGLSAAPPRTEEIARSPGIRSMSARGSSVGRSQGSPRLFLPPPPPPALDGLGLGLGMEMGRMSPGLRERRSTSVTIEKVPKRTLSVSHWKKVPEETVIPIVEAEGGISSNLGEDNRPYCYCQKLSYGDMVACDNDQCEGGEWFHLGCTDLNELPGDSDWYCKLCETQLNGKAAPNKKRKVTKK